MRGEGEAMTHPRELWENTPFHGQEYPFYIFRIPIRGVRRGQEILGLHWHEHFEILVMVRGRAVFHIESQPYEARPGDILLVPSGGLHVGYSLEDQDVEFMAFVFNGSMLESAARDTLHARLLGAHVSGRARFPVRIADAEGNGEFARDCIAKAVEEFKEKRRGYELAIKSYLYLLFVNLSREHVPARKAEELAAEYSRGSERFKPLIRYVEDKYREKITVEEAARLVNLSPFHFCKLFKKLTGRTFVEYVNRHRMNEAEKLLRDTDLSVTEIADRVGCGNPNYFTKLFKQHKGITPSQARGTR